jgi:D-sedoheptulose 7-phosphate isomerase
MTTSDESALSFQPTCSDWVNLAKKLVDIAPLVEESGRLLVSILLQSGKIFTCGNGGSAADALHMSEELLGRYHKERPSLPSICLNGDPTSLTCIANDYGFDHVFSRQLSSLGNPGDVLIVFSTSGNSTNILQVLKQAAEQSIHTIALLGKDGGKARELAEYPIIIPSDNTARIQEAHTMILHWWLEHIEHQMFPNS